jgi:outer membrane protein
VLVQATLVLFPAAVIAQSPLSFDARPVTLEEAIRLARRNAPQAVQADGQVRTAGAQRLQARMALLPNLNLTANTSRQGGETFFQGELVPFRGDPWNFSQGLSSSLDLFTGFRRLHNLRQQDANLDAAEANELATDFNVAQQVSEAYFNVQAAREQEAAARAQVAEAEQQFRAVVARLQAGATTRADSLQQLITVGNAQLALLQAQNALRAQNATLTRLVGTGEVVTAAPGDSLDPAPLATSDDELLRLALQGPAVRNAEAQLGAQRAARKAAFAPYLPTLNMNFGYNRQNTSPSFDWGSGPMSSNYNTRIGLSYNVFNNWQRESQRAQAQVGERNAEATLRDTRLNQQQQLVQFLGNLRTAETRIRVQRASVQAADENLRIRQQRYTLGASPILEVLNAQTQLDNARLALIQARRDARVAKAQIETLIGRAVS